jgi:addiction module RelE/StbE family toxin
MKVKRVDFSKRFEKDLKKSPRKIQIVFRNRLEIYLSDKFNPILNNHSLTGKYEGYRSINVSGDWRAIFREMDGGETVYFDLIGTHSKLYK